MKKIYLLGLLITVSHFNVKAQYTRLFDFDGSINGKQPLANLISDGTFLYGTTDMGGLKSNGVVFKIKSDGTGYVKLIDFDGATNGNDPMGALFYDGAFLYGTTKWGGINKLGTLFKIKPDGTNYVKLLDFDGITNGSYPQDHLFFDGTFLYGSADNGGANDNGVLFKIKPDGTDFTTLIVFDDAKNGRHPSTVISDGHSLYGTTQRGGTNDQGTIFKYLFNATGISKNDLSSDFKIYPNPSSGKFIIEIQNNQKDLNIEIYNVIGEKVLQQQTSKEIDLSDSPRGIYFIRVYEGEKIYTRKIIVE